MCLGYARVSNLDQDSDPQLKGLRAAGCKTTIVEKTSAARNDRPELARLLGGILCEGDTLVVWKLNRLAHSLKQLIETAEDLNCRGIALISLTDAIDTRSPGGGLLLQVLGAIAEFEHDAILQDLCKKGRNGRKGGRPRLLGDRDVKAAKALLADGALASKEVAARFGVSKATLYRHISKGRCRGASSASDPLQQG